MRKLIVRVICILAPLTAILCQDVSAQRRGKADVINTWAHTVTVDGDLSEWEGSLQHLYARQDMEFELRNDDKYIYLAVRVTNLDRQIQALGSGISFTVNTSGRKREGPRITFPIADRITFRGLMSESFSEEERPVDTRVAALKSVRGIQVQQFDHLLDGMISMDNQYGIRAAAAIDTTEALCVEIQLPIHLLNIPEDPANREMAYNLRINGVVMDGVRPRQESGVWNKFKLATMNLQD